MARPRQVVALVPGVGAQRREDEVVDEVLTEVIDYELIGAGVPRTFIEPRPVLTLPEVGAVGRDPAPVGRLEEVQRGRSVQTVGVGEDDVFE